MYLTIAWTLSRNIGITRYQHVPLSKLRCPTPLGSTKGSRNKVPRFRTPCIPHRHLSSSSSIRQGMLIRSLEEIKIQTEYILLHKKKMPPCISLCVNLINLFSFSFMEFCKRYIETRAVDQIEKCPNHTSMWNDPVKILNHISNDNVPKIMVLIPNMWIQQIIILSIINLIS